MGRPRRRFASVYVPLCSLFHPSVSFCQLTRKITLSDYCAAANSDLVVHILSRFLGLSRSPHPLFLLSWYSYYLYIHSSTSHISLLCHYRTGLNIFTSSRLRFFFTRAPFHPREKYLTHR